MKKCLKCNKPFSSPHRGGLPKKYCNVLCLKSALNSKYYYSYRRDSEVYCANASRNMKEWYKKNKAKQNATVLKYYYKNKSKWNEGRWMNKYRQRILPHLPKKCHLCSSQPIKVLHHLEYGHTPKLIPRHKDNDEIIKTFAQKYLIGFCSQRCHARFHRDHVT